ncbi:hypothetical protein ACFYNL_19180 [Streptomyces sp. NPDC007808]
MTTDFDDVGLCRDITGFATGARAGRRAAETRTEAGLPLSAALFGTT